MAIDITALQRMAEEELDELVHELKGQEAAAINNAGREAQIEYVAIQNNLKPTTEESEVPPKIKTNRIYDLWDLEEEDQEACLGLDIGRAGQPIIVVELDEMSQRRFYNRRFAPFRTRETDSLFTARIDSIDDAELVMEWKISQMEILPYMAREMIMHWLKRTNYFVNLDGFASYCRVFGKYQRH